MPSVFAVCKLIDNSTCVGCSTGRSAGLTPASTERRQRGKEAASILSACCPPSACMCSGGADQLSGVVLSSFKAPMTTAPARTSAERSDPTSRGWLTSSTSSPEGPGFNLLMPT